MWVRPGTGRRLRRSRRNSETSKPSYLMCQPELGVGGCSQVVRACHAGAAVPHDVEYALSLCGGEMVYLTVRRVRDVESFPWELPAGWYVYMLLRVSCWSHFSSRLLALELQVHQICLLVVLLLSSGSEIQGLVRSSMELSGHWVNGARRLKTC